MKGTIMNADHSSTRTGTSAGDWRHRAACADEDPELFFPIGNTGPALLQIEDAKAVCATCPVVDRCLQWALESGQDAGVWGGMPEDERRNLKRRASRARARLA
jgi:WhiB family redox-sensing transcriptional regulator